MGYMVTVRLFSQDDKSALVAYTGEIHTEKAKALEEYLEAQQDPAVIDVYITLI